MVAVAAAAAAVVVVVVVVVVTLVVVVKMSSSGRFLFDESQDHKTAIILFVLIPTHTLLVF